MDSDGHAGRETPMSLAGRLVGRDQPPYVVAELSANHRGSLARAIETVQAAARAGADAIKLQTYRPETMTLDLDRGPFVLAGDSPWAGRRLYDLYAEAQTPWEWHPDLAAAAEEAGIAWFSTPFDRSAVDFLESLGAPAYKIASFEIVDVDLIAAAASTGKPLIISTGMASLDEIDLAVATARQAGDGQVALLRCSSAYPAPASSLHLRAIPDMAARWGTQVGFSDHTTGNAAATAAVALGATVIEKHFTTDRSLGGPDAAFSCEPAELAALVEAVHTAWEALGHVDYGPSPAEKSSMQLRRSLWFVEALRTGQQIGPGAVRSLRPAGGLPPRRLPEVLGRRVRRDVSVGTPVTEDLLG